MLFRRGPRRSAHSHLENQRGGRPGRRLEPAVRMSRVLPSPSPCRNIKVLRTYSIRGVNPVSVYLVYFEFGKVRAPADLPPSLRAHPLQLKPYGPHSVWREAVVLRDGLSADLMRLSGPSVAARKGNEQRDSLIKYIASRLGLEIRPLLAFCMFTDLVQTATVDANTRIDISLDHLCERIVDLPIDQVVEVIGPETK